MKKILISLGLLILPFFTFAQMPIGYCDPGPCMMSPFDKNFLVTHIISVIIIIVSALVCIIYFLGFLFKKKIISKSKFFISIAFLFLGIVGLFLLPKIKNALDNNPEEIILPCVPSEINPCEDPSVSEKEDTDKNPFIILDTLRP